MVKENQNEVEILQSAQNDFEEQRLKYLKNLQNETRYKFEQNGLCEFVKYVN